MAVSTPTTEFTIDRFEVDGDRAVVEGRWHGVLGRRFVRPVLRMNGQRRLALLEHKPWAADEGAPWIAAFELAGEPGPGRLEVAPDICVDLPAPGPGVGGERLVARAARVQRTATKAAVKEAVAPAPATPPTQVPADTGIERDRAAELERLTERFERSRDDLDSARAETAELRAALESARDELDVARRDGERAGAETDRLRERLEEARTELEELRAKLDATEAARGRALVEREEMRRELEDARRAPALGGSLAALREPARRTIAAPPVFALREPARRPASWGVRATALLACLLLLYALAWLVSAVT